MEGEMNKNPLRWAIGFSLASIATLLAGCGGGGSASTTPQPKQNSAVTVLLSSRANDRSSQFIVSFSRLWLVSQSGTQVDVIAKPQSVEFIHLNGSVAPLLTATVPQDTYVSANIVTTYSQFTCVTLSSTGELATNTLASTSDNAVVTLPTPLTIGTPEANVLLELQVSQSAQYTTCGSAGSLQPFSVRPIFDLTGAAVVNRPTNSANGLATSLAGLIASVATVPNGFDVTTDYGLTWSVGINSGTALQGVTDASALEVGMPVDMDVAIQADGSLVAARVAVVDTNIANLSTFRGPLNSVVAAVPYLYIGPLEDQGQYLTTAGTLLGSMDMGFGAAVFKISGRFGNVQSLPFSATFNAANMVAGQNVYITNHQLYFSGPNPDPADTITLMPQTIDGTVVAVATSGGFTTYTVALAAYDLFPTLAVQAGQTTLLQNAGTVVVYAGSSTQMLNSAPANVGSVLRFNGLVFNDSGTLRMDCAEVLDGVAP
jgi:hypothetical protein